MKLKALALSLGIFFIGAAAMSAADDKTPVASAPKQVAAAQAPDGWLKTGTPGIYWNFCSQVEDRCYTDGAYLDYTSVVSVWCKDRACGDIYIKANLISADDRVVGWTNASGYGSQGDKVQLLLQTSNAATHSFRVVKINTYNF